MSDEQVLMHHQDGLAELIARADARFLDCSNLSLEEAERLGSVLALLTRGSLFWLGDLARYAEARWPDSHPQVWPEWASPGQLARTAGVCRAYPKSTDRQHQATYTQYMNLAREPNRKALLEEAEGQTTDESRASLKAARAGAQTHRYLLAVDVNYYLFRTWSSGAGVEAAYSLAEWISNTIDRLNDKYKALPITDVCCCFDSPTSFRKDLTANWPDKYKDRPQKDPEYLRQLTIARDILESSKGFTCAAHDGMEGDDIMASLAEQFDGVVTLLTQDKDMRQCLSGHCNILLDIEWLEDEHSGEVAPKYQWLSRLDHFEQTGIPPTHWTEYQCLMGDNVDGIRGAEGIGKKFAADLIQWFETAEGAIAAARAGDERITKKKREALIEFEGKLAVTRQLVTLRTDLLTPQNTRI